jgi:hypothetical protein
MKNRTGEPWTPAIDEECADGCARNCWHDQNRKFELLEDRILADDSASFWLKDAIIALEQRDPVDALSDAETLVKILRERLNKIMGVK